MVKDFFIYSGGIVYFEQLWFFFEFSLVCYVVEYVIDEQIVLLMKVLEINSQLLDDNVLFICLDVEFYWVLVEIFGNLIFMVIYVVLLDWLIVVCLSVFDCELYEYNNVSY